MRIIPAPVKPHKYGSNRRSVMPSRVKRAVYAFAFGLGLAIGFLLVRNAPAPPVAQDRASQHPIRRTATTPETTMRVNHPPALPSMRTPRAESNNRAPRDTRCLRGCHFVCSSAALRYALSA